MNTLQIQDIMDKKLGKKTSVVGPANSITDLVKNKYIILNTDCSCHPGTHWVALHRVGKKEFEFFDSFGKDIGEYVCLENLKNGHVIKGINIRLQNHLTNVCGQYALFFLIARKNGHSVKDIYKIFKNKPTIKNDIVLYRVFENKFGINTSLLI